MITIEFSIKKQIYRKLEIFIGLTMTDQPQGLRNGLKGSGQPRQQAPSSSDHQQPQSKPNQHREVLIV